MATNKHRVMVPSNMGKEGVDILRARGDIEVVVYPTAISQADLLPLLADVSGIALSATPYRQTELDASPAMLAVAAAKLQRCRAANWQVRVADHLRLPAPSGGADLALAGWSLCYAALDYDRWRETVSAALGEMRRVLRPGGTCLIIETQGTGFETPHPPEILKPYLDYLSELGFQSEWIRTDYQFESLAEAEALIGFFFGDELAAQTVREGWQVVPECTGLWWQ